MTSQLTAAGVAFCATLLGEANIDEIKDTERCVIAFMRVQPPADWHGHGPGVLYSCLDDSSQCSAQKDKACTAVKKYSTFDGSSGTNYFCRYNAKLVWLPDGRWAWEVEHGK